MKKIFLALFALVMSINASAFEFDGIDLNASMLSITRNISMRGYVNDDASQGLKGMCQGQEIYLRFNFDDVNQKGKLGQLFVDVPMKDANALENVKMIFNVIYHLVEGNTDTYLVDNDGTTVKVESTNFGIRLTYNTPYYKTK